MATATSNLSVARTAYAIVPHNTVDYATRFRSIYVGGAGDITLKTAEGAIVLFSAVPAGFILPVEGLRVNVTGTTATLLVGLV